MWEALTERAQLEEWFANEVELDARPGGRGVFRWGNGETREAIVESVEEGAGSSLRFDDDGAVDSARAGDGGHARQVRRARQLSTALGAARAPRACAIA